MRRHLELQQDWSHDLSHNPKGMSQEAKPERGGGPWSSNQQTHRFLKEHDHFNSIELKDWQWDSQFAFSQFPTTAEQTPPTTVNCTVLHKLEKKNK